MEYIKKQLFTLMGIDSPDGITAGVISYIANELKSLGFEPQLTKKGGLVCCLGGEGTPMMLSAHADTLGAMVAEVKGNGRLRLTPIGGMQPQNGEAENVKIMTRGGAVYEGTFQMNDPSAHVNKEYSSQQRDYSSMEVVIDENTASQKETTALGICVGDYVCFDPRTRITESGYIKSRFLDDKLSVSILLGLAKEVSEKKLTLARKVYIYITVYEEVGHGCSSGIPDDVEELLCVDMGCVGMGLTCTERQVSICVKDSRGPYNYDMTTKLINLAKENKIDYATDVYPYYGSDADAALESGYDIRHALIGAGVYASHGYERSHIDGVKNTLALIKAYVSQKA